MSAGIQESFVPSSRYNLIEVMNLSHIHSSIITIPKSLLIISISYYHPSITSNYITSVIQFQFQLHSIIYCIKVTNRKQHLERRRMMIKKLLISKYRFSPVNLQNSIRNLILYLAPSILLEHRGAYLEWLAPLIIDKKLCSRGLYVIDRPSGDKY